MSDQPVAKTLYLTTHNSQQTSMLQARFEPAIPAAAVNPRLRQRGQGDRLTWGLLHIKQIQFGKITLNVM